jgi:TorA maturation chaperone TorD
LAHWRQVAYRLFSSTLLYPNEERLNSIAAAAMELHKQSHAMEKFAFSPKWQRLLTSLTCLPGHQDLEEEYIRVFMHNSEGTPCLPYESVFMDIRGQAAGWIVALLEGEYAAAGLALSPSLKDLPDHVAVELEFMAFLCGQEADAWTREAVKEAVQAMERQAIFLDRHLTLWLPEWVALVAIADGEGIYSMVAETTQAFVSHDQDLIGTLSDKFRRMSKVAQTGMYSKSSRRKSAAFREVPPC